MFSPGKIFPAFTFYSLTNGKANSIADADKQMVQQFMAWNHWLDSTQKELEAKATPHQRRHVFDEIKFALNEQNSPDSLFVQLLKIRIKAYARYNFLYSTGNGKGTYILQRWILANK